MFCNFGHGGWWLTVTARIVNCVFILIVPCAVAAVSLYVSTVRTRTAQFSGAVTKTADRRETLGGYGIGNVTLYFCHGFDWLFVFVGHLLLH